MPPVGPWVAVVTLTWNQRDDTLRCLESLSGMTYPCYRLLLVDNASVDNTVAQVRERFPAVEILVNPRNLGLPGGFNVGLRQALAHGADYIFMINNDTTVAPDILEALVDQAESSSAGMLAPKIFYAGEPDRIWSVGGRQSFWTLEMVDTGDKQWDRGQWETVLERDYLVGCALLIKRSLLEQIGLFDEGFYPIYYEDSDLCVRARRAGAKLLLVPQARMWHKGVASGGGFDSPRQRYLMARNSVRFFRKHVRGWRWLVVVPYRLGSIFKTSLRLLLRRRFQALAAHWRGLRDGLLNRFDAL